MEPVSAAGLVASVLQIITATAQTIQYLNDVKDAPKDRAKIAQEASNLLVLLTSLRYRLDDASPTDPWFARLLTLGGPGGPLVQYGNTMEELAVKLRAKSGIQSLGQRLIWTIDKKQIKDVLDRIERLKSLIGLALQEDNFALSLAIKNGMSRLGNDMVEISDGVAELSLNQRRDAALRLDDESQAIISWLSPLNFASKQIDVSSRRQEGTGEWLLEADEFNSWLSGNKRTLWCPGIPGAGKTILTSVVVDYVEHAFPGNEAVVAYIYNDYKEHEAHSVVNLVGSLLQQVLQRKRVVSDEIISLHNVHSYKRTRPTVGELSRILSTELQSFSDVFFIIDAMDECDHASGVRDRFLAELSRLQEHPSTRLMVTSRFLAGLEIEFRDAARLEIRASDNDIKKYVEDRICNEKRLVRYIKPDRELYEAIVIALVNSAEGMFLIARLHMDSLAKKQNKRDIRQGYKNLPKEINGTYDEAMKRISSQDDEDVQLAKQVLSWLLYAQRPLTVTELQHALATEPEARALDEEALPDEDLLVSVCAGLVVVENESAIIRLVHYTTQEYFERVQMHLFPTAKIDIAASCLTYLMFDDYSCLDLADIDYRFGMEEAFYEWGLNESYPLLNYAVPYWADHTRGETEQHPQVQRLAFQLLESECRTVRELRDLSHQSYNFILGDRDPLHAAASFGLEHIAMMLMDEGVPVDASVKGLTALHCAAEKGHADVSLMLLQRGAQTYQKTLRNSTALHFAATWGHCEVAKHLLEFGAILDAKDAAGRTPLFEAACSGQRDVVRLLLEAGADVNMGDGIGCTPLHSAAWNFNPVVWDGPFNVAQLLAGAEVKVQEHTIGTPVVTAADDGLVEMVQLMIAAGADINARTHSGLTAIDYAAECGLTSVVESLIEAGADSVLSALERAVQQGQIDVVKLLIEVGVDVNAGTREGKPLLDIAVEDDFGSIVQLLMDAGAKTANQVKIEVESGQDDHAIREEKI